MIFINKYNKPIRIWKTISKTSFKGFVVPGNIYKLKTMVANQNKPVVYHAEALAEKSSRLLLEGQESISILPFDCDDTFMNVTVTTAASVHQNGKVDQCACVIDSMLYSLASRYIAKVQT